MSYNIYLIKSEKTLSDLRELLGNDVFLKIIYRKGMETDLTVTILDDEQFDNAKNKSRLRIFPFIFDTKFMPSEKKNELVIPIPSFFKNDAKFVEKTITDKMDTFIKYGLLSKDDFRIKMHFLSRKDGTLGTKCFLIFDEKIPMEKIATIKFLLDKTVWNDVDNYSMECYWKNSKFKKFDKKQKYPKKQHGSGNGSGNGSRNSNTQEEYQQDEELEQKKNSEAISSILQNNTVSNDWVDTCMCNETTETE